MCFNKFLECTDDLLRSTEIEAKKHENKAFLKEGETPQQNKRRSFAKIGAIDRPKTTKIEVQQSGRRSFAKIQPNDRPGEKSRKNSLGRTFAKLGRSTAKLGGRSPDLGER